MIEHGVADVKANKKQQHHNTTGNFTIFNQVLHTLKNRGKSTSFFLIFISPFLGIFNHKYK